MFPSFHVFFTNNLRMYGYKQLLPVTQRTLKRRSRKYVQTVRADKEIRFSNDYEDLGVSSEASSAKITNISNSSDLYISETCDDRNISGTSTDRNNFETSNKSNFIDFEFNENVLMFDDYESESEDEVFVFTEKQSFEEDLRIWIKTNSITGKAVDALLTLLVKRGHKQLPKTYKTLFNVNSRKQEIISVEPGNYCHLGLENAIKTELSLLPESVSMNLPSNLEIDFNIDGLPISKSSQNQFWPILCLIKNLNSKTNVIVAGIYHGWSKPKDSSIYLQKFVEEVKVLSSTGFIWNKKTFTISLRAMICDAPAKSFVCAVKGHNGHFGCTKCMQEGEYLNNRMSFPDLENTLRTDENFKNRSNEEFHMGSSSLEEIMGLISQVPLDYMHLVCLGLKKLILLWMKGPLNVRLSAATIKKISESLLLSSLTQPKEFQRRIRGLDTISNWKATEFRTFLMYSGPIVLQNLVSQQVYNHFMLLHCAIRILTDPSLYLKYNFLAKKLLTSYVEQFTNIYGRCYISHNVHNLLHLSDCAMLYGPLDNFSAFPFEAKLGFIKKMPRHGYKALEQVVNRIQEYPGIKMSEPSTVTFKTSKKVSIKENKNSEVFKEIVILANNLTINSSCKNKWFLSKALEIVEFDYVYIDNKVPKIYGRSIKLKRNFYETPIKSSYINIYSSNYDFNSSKIWRLEEIKCKIFALDVNENYTFMPMN